MKSLLSVLLLSLALPALAGEAQDAAYLAARDAFRAGDRARLDRAAAQLGASHELSAYVENYRLRMQMDQGDAASLRSFLDKNDKSYVAERLRADWVRWLAKRTQWTEVEAEYGRLLAPEADITCYQQQARLARDDRSALDEAARQWLTLLEPPEPCRVLFESMTSRFSVSDVWARARRQVEINRPNGVRQTLSYLPAAEMPEGRALEQALGSPAAYLARPPAGWQKTRAGRELAAFAIARMAANDPQAAASELERQQASLQESERQWAWSQVALQGARRHVADTLVWYGRAGRASLSDEGFQWKVRAALRAHEWGLVRDTIQAMPAELAARPEWVYWLGRAWKAGGNLSEAESLFRRIAGEPHFYGSLAEEELGRLITLPPKASAPTAEEQRAARDNIGLLRALAFFRLDMRTEGVREWNWALRGMSDRELLAAAELAKRNQIWDRAINTADKTRSEHDFSLRYLAPYGEAVRPVARNQSLDDAWVYGLMRQESRFITNAKSSVGAAGLMQLMPATAKWVAKKIGMNDFHPGKVTQTETNVLLGTNYMRMVMENLDNHPVLASAAYNAGPGRARRWRADRPLEGAIYAETIPFSETRDYVKKVMSNAVFYSLEFNGKPESLKQRLGVIAARMADTPKDADLP